MLIEMGLNMQRVVITILISLCAFITAPDGYGRQNARVGSQSSGVLSEKDQAEIVKSVLEHAIANPVTTFSVSWTEFVSSENLTSSMLPNIFGYKFELLEPGKI